MKTNSDSSEAPVLKGSSRAVFNVAEALERMDGDRDLLKEIALLFEAECPKSMAEIRGALDARNAPLLERLAHSLKGSAANVGANCLSTAASTLEALARAGDLPKVAEQFETVKNETARLLPELHSLLQKGVP